MAASVVSPSSYHNQTQIVCFIYGGAYNYTANVSQNANATNYACNYVSSFGALNNSLAFVSIWTKLSLGYPIEAIYGYYNNGVRTGGHVVLIYKATITNSGQNIISYYDPLNGQSYDYLYEVFLNGIPNRIYDQTVYPIIY